MPIRRKYTTKKGKKTAYYQWGQQKKYYYKIGDRKSQRRAYRKAGKQARAIYSSKK